ncbi:MAG TPA: DUF4907 domain-containing protein [Chitinophagaceae bacterium]|nr:DUF4907 domain-containing protein [Chitinophagaceae bacterium]
MIIKIIILSLGLFLASTSLPAQNKVAKSNFTYTCFQNVDKTWGYDILSSGKLFIHQPTIPAIQGLKGFADKQSASKVAKLVLKKLSINQNEFPAIHINEIKYLRVKT